MLSNLEDQKCKDIYYKRDVIRWRYISHKNHHHLLSCDVLIMAGPKR